jgi:hypothetical protein
MATYYVNKSGSDANSGADADNAKLTITGAIAVSGNDDSIIVGSGFYNETITTNRKKFYADGHVVVDGENKSGVLIAIPNSYSLIYFYPHTTGGSWKFINSQGTSIVSFSQGNAGHPILYFENCSFIASGTTTSGVTTYVDYRNSISTSFVNCVFSGFSQYAAYQNATGGTSLNHCIVYNCPTGIYVTAPGAGNLTIANSIFSKCTKAWYAKSAVTSDVNHYYEITNWQLFTTTWTTFAALQSSGRDVNSVEADPQFLDPANNVFFQLVKSGALRNIGAYSFGLARGSAYAGTDTTWKDNGVTADNTGWYNPDENIDIESDNVFRLYGSSGVMWSPVYDLNAHTAVTRVDIAADQRGTHMIDTTKTDTKPNYQTIEVRGSETTFDQDDDVITWTEVKSGIAFDAISCRFFQLRLTFRADDVEA